MIYHHKVEIIPETDNHVKGENTVVISVDQTKSIWEEIQSLFTIKFSIYSQLKKKKKKRSVRKLQELLNLRNVIYKIT